MFLCKSSINLCLQEEEKEIINIKQEEPEKTNLLPLEVNIGNYNDKVNASSNFSRKNKITVRNSENLINYHQTITTMKEIKNNFMEEHKSIIIPIIHFILNA